MKAGLVLLASLLSPSIGVSEMAVDEALEANTVPVLYRHIGITRGVPYKILYSVALAESGLTVDGRYEPWPWTLNVGGKPARFDTREEAAVELRAVIASGKRNVDIGPAQINARYNGDLLPTLEQGLDPATSLDTATQVLLRELGHCEKQLGRLDWWCAVERYHSPGKSDKQRKRAVAYAERVRRHHQRLER